VLIVEMLIFSGRCETPVRSSGTGETPLAQRKKEVHRPAKSEHPGAENQQSNLTEPYIYII
jgi:hypothetical protein